MLDIFNNKILIGTSNSRAVNRVAESFGNSCSLTVAETREKCLNAFSVERYDISFIDIDFLADEDGDFEKGLKPYFKSFPAAIIIAMADRGRIRDAIYAIKAGASDYFTYPGVLSEIRLIVDREYEKKRSLSELDYLRSQVFDVEEDISSTSRSPVMKEVLAKAASVAPTRTTVLLTGETGTGKSVIAALLHSMSNRSNRQFIRVHCGAIPDSLIESELFGHEKGAFTGAVKRKMGQFEIAHNGTIFLDEIGTVSKSLQIKLLQVLQEKTFHRVGGEAEIKSNVRIIAATNDRLEKLVEEGSFRRDLFYRLNVFPIELPPLRERKEDIIALAVTFIRNFNDQYQKNITALHPDVETAFLEYSWPGNIREMENIIERACIIEQTSLLTPESFPGDMFQTFKSPVVNAAFSPEISLAEVRKKAVAEIERQYLKELLTHHRGRINKSAETAGITTRQLHKLLVRYGIQKNDFKKN